MRALSSGNVVSVIFMFRHFDSRQPTGGAPSRFVTGNLHLAAQGVHVGKQACLRQHRRVDLFRRGEGRRLVEYRRHVGQSTRQRRN